MSAEAASVPTPTPPPTARGERLLGAVDNLFARLDRALARWLPDTGNPLAQSGAMANFALLIAVVSGVALLVWYRSSLHQAHDSLAALALDGRSLGGWVRAVHRYSSDMAMAFIMLHALRMLAARKFAGARWLAWVSGVGMIALVWFIGWTGFWLVWDQPAREIAVTSMQFLDGLPIFGEPLARLFLTDRMVPSLLFFVVFFLHMLLPLMIAVGLLVHVLRLNRVRLLPSRRLQVAALVALAVASWWLPAPLDPPARMMEKPAELTVDAWYLTPLALALRWQSGGLWVAIGGVGLLGAALPWLLGRRFSPKAREDDRRPPAAFQTVVDADRCHACTQCVQDCPYDAVHMVPRSDTRWFATEARVDPTLCVGCAVCVGSCDSEAMRMPWFDAVDREPGILAGLQAKLAEGQPVKLALVAGDAWGEPAAVARTDWSRALPGYTVEAVPTAAWVRPKFIERVLAAGVERVAIVGDGRAESASRDGNRWAVERMAGTRKPSFRPFRAGGRDFSTVRVFESVPGATATLTKEVAAWETGRADQAPAPWNAARTVACLVLLTAIIALVAGGSHLWVRHPASDEPELVVSFKALGAREANASALSAEQQAKLPVHMRGRSFETAKRVPVELQVTVDGVTGPARRYDAKGVSRDGPAIDVWRRTVPPGRHDVMIKLTDENGTREWTTVIEARSRHLSVITYDPAEGFRLE
ncbi:MAG: cytochrome b N-terminal domain-containing protein [Opitutaceae bacterium]|nr:cytochrome b N-terminal domain-containing protein [Opitutaceae bacterium]